MADSYSSADSSEQYDDEYEHEDEHIPGAFEQEDEPNRLPPPPPASNIAMADSLSPIGIANVCNPNGCHTEEQSYRA